MTSGSEKRQRFRNLTIRLTLVERAMVDAFAERAGVTAGSLARQRILGGPLDRQVRRPPVERMELTRLLGEVGKVGGNLNQLAKAVNTGVLVYGNEIDAALADLMTVRNAILKALGREP